MAPTAPKKRPSIRARTAKTTPSSTSTTPSTLPPSSTLPSLPSTKLQKRQIKSSTFLSRITKAHSKPLKQRRPAKKLVTTLESLADALPDIQTLVDEVSKGDGKIKVKSLKSKPGAQKRKGKLEKMERERFGRNLAVMMAGEADGGNGGVGLVVGEGHQLKQRPDTSGGAAATATTGRFAALRAWAEQNMEKHPAFEKKS